MYLIGAQTYAQSTRRLHQTEVCTKGPMVVACPGPWAQRSSINEIERNVSNYNVYHNLHKKE